MNQYDPPTGDYDPAEELGEAIRDGEVEVRR